MIDLLRCFSFRYLRARPLRAFMAFISIALGVALFVSTDVATTSVVTAVEEGARALSGKAEWQVTRGTGTGVEDSLAAEIRKLPGAIAAPLVRAPVKTVTPEAGTLMLLGVDFRNDSLLRLYQIEGRPDAGTFLRTALVPDAVIIPRQLADLHDLAVASGIDVATRDGVKTLRVTGILEDVGPAGAFQGRFAIMELGAAQRLFGRPGLVDRIEVAGVSREALESACPGHIVRPASSSGNLVRQALERLRSLISISVVALVVGVFIIYNTVSISVVERVKEIATLRALGATRRQIRSMIVIEWLVVGVLGSAVGVAFGYLLARLLLGEVTHNLNMLVHIVDVEKVVLSTWTLVWGLVLGTAATLAASIIPARHATASPPVDVLRQHGYRLAKSYRGVFIVGAAVIAVGVVLIATGLSVSTIAGFACTGLFFIGVALMLPQITVTLSRWLKPSLRRRLSFEGYLGADNISKFPQRTTLTVTALGGGLAMMIASASLVESFIDAAQSWMDHAFPFDLAVSTTDFEKAVYSDQVLPQAAVDDIRSNPEVAVAYGVRCIFTDFDELEVLLLSLDFDEFLDGHRRRGHNTWSEQFRDPALVEAMNSGRGVAIAENFAYRFGVGAGDTIELSTPEGRRSFEVTRVFEDYSWPFGLVMMDRSVYENLWHDDTVTYVDICLADGVDRGAFQQHLTEALGERFTLYVYDIADIKQTADDAMRDAVALGDVQVLIAIVIGFLGIVNSLLISVLQRTREIGLLRAVGMTRRQVSRSVMLEALYIGLVGGVIGIITGLAGGWFPLRYFTLGITGYLTPIVVPWKQMAMAIIAAALIGVFASVLPARRASAVNVIDAIGYE